MSKKIFWIITLFALGAIPATGWTEKTPDSKKICKEARDQLKAIEKELTEIEEKRSQIQHEIELTKPPFNAEQDKLRGMTHCSQGNPNNPPGCEAQLQKVREMGDQITQLQNSLNPLTPRRVQLENSIYKPRNDLILNKCGAD